MSQQDVPSGRFGVTIAGVVALAMCAAVLSGCSVLRGPNFLAGNSLKTTSNTQFTQLSPRARTRIYHLRDENTADVYLSDLSEDDLLAELKLADSFSDLPPCTITHLYLFIVPKAGRTPIDYSASDMTIEQIIAAGGAAGYYGGGGFLLPNGSIEGRGFSGKVNGATIRFLGGTDGFEDLIGSGVVSGGVNVYRDDELAIAIGARMRALVLNDFPQSVAGR